MILDDVDRKLSRWKKRNGMEFNVPRVVVSIFNINRSKPYLTIFFTDILKSHNKEFFG